MRGCRRLLPLALCAGLLGACDSAADVPLLMDPLPEPLALDFALPDLSGAIHRLGDYRGDTLLVNFWAVWCVPCRTEMPDLNQVHQARADKNFKVLGVHVGPGDIPKFLESVPVDFPILVDDNLELTDWPAIALPATFLVTPDGVVRYQALGIRHWNSEEAHRFYEFAAEQD